MVRPIVLARAYPSAVSFPGRGTNRCAMKFLCEQCKAKYQISDDKVAGKTVRMKCRKCGHMIEVKAEVTETSVSKSLPPPDGIATVPEAPKSGPQAGTAAGQPKAPLKPAAARPGSLATSLSAARPGAPRPPAASMAREGALAGAFQKQVSGASHKKDDEISAALDMLEMSSEWYVAINGVPVGPVRVSELRRKASMGAVTEDSLVWQEGLEEWRPVRSVTELAQLVREAAAGGRPSLIPPEPRASTPPPPPMAQPTPGVTTAVAPRPPLARAAPPPRAPSRPEAPPAAAVARSNVVPITSRLATAEKLDVGVGVPATDAVRASLDAAPFPAPLPQPERPPPPVAAVDPFAVPSLAPPQTATPAPPAPGSIANVSGAVALPPAEVPPKKAPPWIAIAMLVLAATFGVTAAIVLFLRAPPAPIIVQAPPSAQPTPPPPSASAPPPPADSVAAAPSASVEKPGPVAVRGGGGGGGPRPAAAAGGGNKLDLGDLLKGPGGAPVAGPGGGGGGGGGSSSLSSSQIESVVHGHAPGVKRSCWEKVGSQSNTVNVTCHVVIAGSGAVQSVSANGDDATVSKCIENAIRGWSFPPSGGTTNVDIPFHFVRQ